ncbi:MAG: hypothetical protein V1779_00695 [bacterium]
MDTEIANLFSQDHKKLEAECGINAEIAVNGIDTIDVDNFMK